MKVRTYGVFDIGAASVGGDLVQVENGKSTLLWGARAEYAFGATQSYGAYVKRMHTALARVADTFLQEGLASAHARASFRTGALRLRCLVDAPWCWGGVRTFEDCREKSFYIDRHWRDEARASLARTLTEDTAFLAWKRDVGEMQTLEMTDTLLLGDGYTLTEERVEVKEAELHTFYSFIAAAVGEGVRERIAHVFPHHPLTCVSVPHFFLPLFNTCRPVREERVVGLLAGELETQVFLFEKGALTGNTTVPFGTFHLMRACAPSAKSRNEAYGVARQVLRGVSKDTIPPKAVVRILAEWRAGVDNAVLELSHHLPPCGVVCLAGPFWYNVFHFALTTLETTVHFLPHRFTPFREEKKETVVLRDFRARAVAEALAYTEDSGV